MPRTELPESLYNRPMGADATLLAAISTLAASSQAHDVPRRLLEACLLHTPGRRGAARVTMLGRSTPNIALDSMSITDFTGLHGQVKLYAAPGRPLVAGNGSSFMRALPRSSTIGSLLYAEHTSDSCRVEVLLLSETDGDALEHGDLDVVEPLLSIAAVTAANISYVGRSRRYAQWMHAIEDTAVVLLRGVAPRAVLDGVLDEVARHALSTSGATLAGVATPDDEGDGLMFRVAVGRRRDFLTGLTFPEDHSLCGDVMRKVRPVSVVDATHDPRTYPPVVSELDLGPTAVGPLTLQNRVVGVLFVGNLHGDGSLDQTRALEAVAIDDLDGLVRSTTGTTSVSTQLQSRLRKLQATTDGWARFATLDDRQLVMLELVAEGLTNAEIGERLNLAEKTVRNAVSTLLAKLGVTNRVEAAVMIARHAERFGRLRS